MSSNIATQLLMLVCLKTADFPVFKTVLSDMFQIRCLLDFVFFLFELLFLFCHEFLCRTVMIPMVATVQWKKIGGLTHILV